MPSGLRVLISDSTDPWFNLATEDWIFREMAADTHVLFLWRNRPCVVFGRHQNPWVECNLERMRRDGVVPARRQSGGGTVYHDPGNMNFTFLSPTGEYSRDRNFAIVLQALRSLGVGAFRTGRNDILCPTPGGDRKISGNAFKHTRERSFHHGTILVEADLERLGLYLSPTVRRMEARGTRSVSSPVANVRDIVPGVSFEGLYHALARSFLEHPDLAPGHHGHPPSFPGERLRESDLEGIPTLREYYEKMSAREWIYGMTPEFHHTLSPAEGVELVLTIREGRIAAVVVHSDEARMDEDASGGSASVGRNLELLLPGHPYDGREIARILAGSVPEHISAALAQEIGGIP